MNKTTAYRQEILSACHLAGCPLCLVLDLSLSRYLDSLFYEYVNDADRRAVLRISRGICKQYAWQAASLRAGNPLGIAIINQDVIQEILRHYPLDDRGSKDTGAASSTGRQVLLRRIKSAVRAFRPVQTCPACTHRDQTQATLLASFADEMATPDFVAALEASDGLCIFHLGLALQADGGKENSGILLRIGRNQLVGLHAELSELIRKNDYRYTGEEWGEERKSWLRSIRLLHGSKPQE